MPCPPLLWLSPVAVCPGGSAFEPLLPRTTLPLFALLACAACAASIVRLAHEIAAGGDTGAGEEDGAAIRSGVVSPLRLLLGKARRSGLSTWTPSYLRPRRLVDDSAAAAGSGGGKGDSSAIELVENSAPAGGGGSGGGSSFGQAMGTAGRFAADMAGSLASGAKEGLSAKASSMAAAANERVSNTVGGKLASEINGTAGQARADQQTMAQAAAIKGAQVCGAGRPFWHVCGKVLEACWLLSSEACNASAFGDSLNRVSHVHAEERTEQANYHV